MTKSGVYEIRNMRNSKRYLGSSVSLVNRFAQHKSDLRYNKHRNGHLQYAWNKYSEQNFEFNVLFYTRPEYTLAIEQILLDELMPEYNIAKNAEAPHQGLRHSEETRKKIGEAGRGRMVKEETKNKLSRAGLGNKNALGNNFSHTEKAKQKISRAKMGNKVWLGRRHSEETRLKMSESQKLRQAKERTSRKASL